MINKTALDKVINGKPEERVYLCGKDFSLFFVYYFLDYVKYPFAPFHYEMFDDIKGLMNGTYREIAWIMFRESAKTSFSKIFIIWLIVYKKRKYLNVDSFSVTNAERILFDVVLALQTNKRLIADFGEIFNSKRNTDEASQKRINNFVTNNGVRVEAHSTQKSVRGRLHGNQRPDFLLLDDFETNETKDSKAHTKSVIEHIDEFKAGLDSTAIVIYLGNYITEYGSIQTLFNRAKTDTRLKMRSVPVIENDAPTWQGKYAMTDTEAKETGKISLEDKRRQLGSQVFSAEMMNQPIDEASQVFFKSQFKYKSKEHITGLITRKFVTIDTALSKGSDSDYTGIIKCYVDSQNNWYIDAKQYKINTKSLIDLIFQYHAEGFEQIGVEQTAMTEAIKPFFDDECRIRNRFPLMVDLKHGGTMKETRIKGLIPRYERGTVFHIEGQCEDLEQQLLRFPNSLHDDLCLIGDTLIITKRGNVKIKDVIVGDFVMTRKGWKPVIDSRMTGNKRVVSNLGITGTHNHPVITDIGIIDLVNARESDILHIWNSSKQKVEKLSFTMGRSIIDTQNKNTHNSEIIFGNMTLRYPNLCIDKYGLIIMEIYQRTVIFITKTLIHSIIKLVTLSVCKLKNILSTILSHSHSGILLVKTQKRIIKKCKKQQKSGVLQMKVLDGIQTTQKQVFLNLLRVIVNIAEFILRVLDKKVLVQINVGQDTTQEILELETHITIPTEQWENVYNLTVKDANEFFANGILVHNCDAMAYMLHVAEPPYAQTWNRPSTNDIPMV